MSEISFLVGLKNNLEYSQKFYQHFRETYPKEQLVFVSFGSSDGTDEWLDTLDDKNVIFHHDPEAKSLSDTYNKAIEIATKKYVCFLHNDMVLGQNFVSELKKALEKNALICYKTIEPPVFKDDNRLWKEIQDFGNDFDDFNFTKFFEFEKNSPKSEAVKVENVSFFLATKREILMKINGLDPLFKPMFCEDDDLIIRLKLSGEKPVLFPSAVVYHFVSKTSRFSTEYKNTTQIIEQNSHRNFYRKWGFGNHALHQNKRTFGLVLENATLQSVTALEPFVSHIYSDYDPSEYIKTEQQKTIVDLSEKFLKSSDPVLDDVIINFNGKKLSEKNLRIFRNLNDLIIKKRSEKSTNALINLFFPSNKDHFKMRDVHFKILRDQSYEKELIIRKKNA